LTGHPVSICLEISFSVLIKKPFLFDVAGAKRKEAPQFDIYHLDNHTVQLGAIAFLPCTIKNLGNKSVSFKFLAKA
jgi:hypothetical protein